MFSLSKFLIQTPKHLHDIQSSRSNRIREISTTRRITDTTDFTSTFIETSQSSTQVSRITTFCRHFSQTTRNFTKSFGPSRSRISHHTHIVTHITEVFSKSNSYVNRSFTSSYRHVGSVSYQSSTFHDTFLLSSNFNTQLREIHKYFSHFVTTFSTTDINNTIRVRVFRQRLRNDSFSTTESTRNSSSSSLHTWEQSIQNTLSSE